MILSTEGLSANVARVRPLVRVRAFVNEQIVGLCKLAVAELADELLLGTGCAAGSTEESRIVLTRVEGRHVACSQPGPHEQWNAVRVLQAEGILGSVCARSGRLGTFLLWLFRGGGGGGGVLGCLSGGQLRLEALEHGCCFEHRLWVVLSGEELLVGSGESSGRLRRS